MSLEFDPKGDRRSGSRDWFMGLPLWQKIVFLFVSIPAWLYIIYCVIIGENESAAAGAAFGVFAATVLLFIFVDHRRSKTRQGIDKA